MLIIECAPCLKILALVRACPPVQSQQPSVTHSRDVSVPFVPSQMARELEDGILLEKLLIDGENPMESSRLWDSVQLQPWLTHWLVAAVQLAVMGFQLRPLLTRSLFVSICSDSFPVVSLG